MTHSPTTDSTSPPPGAPAAQSEERAGVLRGGAVLTLQTRQAQRLVKGRGYSADKPAIIGLIGFANLVRSAWHGARADDPYADWWMLKIHDALDQSERELSSMERVIAGRLEGLGALEVGPPVSTNPARISLNFSNPYAFHAARVVGAFDALVCKILSARHVGLLARDETEGMLHQGGRVVRRVLQSPVRCSPDTFVLRVRGESMEPKFHDGDLIFVDPQVAPVSGRYVVVRLEDSQEATFKQLIVEDGRQYLKALNPDWPHRIIEVNVDATICGVIVFKGELV